jgi:hypothetical protein
MLIFFFAAIGSSASGSKNVTFTAEISNSAVINYPPSPEPTPSPSSLNLALAPQNWGDGPYSTTATLLYGDPSRAQCWSIDNSVLYNGQPTMRCGPSNSYNQWRELDLWEWSKGYIQPFKVKPGDRIVLSAMIKQDCSAKGVPDGTRKAGNAVIYFDVGVFLPNGTMRFVQTVCGPNSWSHPEAPDTYDQQCFTIVGDGWVYCYVDVVIPATVIDVWNGGGQVVPEYISPIISGGWLSTSSEWQNYVQEQSTAWFADTKLYINP